MTTKDQMLVVLRSEVEKLTKKINESGICRNDLKRFCWLMNSICRLSDNEATPEEVLLERLST